MRVLSLSTHVRADGEVTFLELHKKKSAAAFSFSTTTVEKNMFKTYKNDTIKIKIAQFLFIWHNLQQSKMPN